MPAVSEFLQKQREVNDAKLVDEWTTIKTLYEKKLWHQLTLKSLELMRNPAFSHKLDLIDMYTNFISDFEHRINPMSLMEMIVLVVERFSTVEQALDFLKQVQGKVKKYNEPTILCLTMIALVKLQQSVALRASDAPAGDSIKELKLLMDDIGKMVDDLDGVTQAHRRYYYLTSEYYKFTGEHAQYYREALRYLGCIKLTDLSDLERQQRAVYLSLAAILGDDVYNLGELLQHPIINSLAESDQAWLLQLLRAFNAGDLAEFERLSPQWTKQVDLASRERALRQKLCLMALIELCFRRPATKRLIAFADISQFTCVRLDEVEFLVMKAMAKGLIRGSIDQVDQVVNVTWVQPRVLDFKQLEVMKTKITDWALAVGDMRRSVTDECSDMLAAANVYV